MTARPLSRTGGWRPNSRSGDAPSALHGLLGRLRGGPDVVKDVEASVPHDVVVTHDGSLLFAYAADEATIMAARGAIEGVLQRDGIAAKLRVSVWDDERDRWSRQIRRRAPPSRPQSMPLSERVMRSRRARWW